MSIREIKKSREILTPEERNIAIHIRYNVRPSPEELRVMKKQVACIAQTEPEDVATMEELGKELGYSPNTITTILKKAGATPYRHSNNPRRFYLRSTVLGYLSQRASARASAPEKSGRRKEIVV